MNVLERHVVLRLINENTGTREFGLIRMSRKELLEEKNHIYGSWREKKENPNLLTRRTSIHN